MSQIAFEKETREIVAILRDTYNKITAIDQPEIAGLKARILTDIRRHENSLSLQLGEDIELKEIPSEKSSGGQLTRIFGKEIKPISRNQKISDPQPVTSEKITVQNSKDIELQELRTQVDELLPRFVSTANEDLLDVVPDIVLRGIAKRAGLPVTETNPKKISSKYVDQIKNALKKHADIKAAGNTSNENEDSDATDDQQ